MRPPECSDHTPKVWNILPSVTTWTGGGGGRTEAEGISCFSLMLLSRSVWGWPSCHQMIPPLSTEQVTRESQSDSPVLVFKSWALTQRGRVAVRTWWPPLTAFQGDHKYSGPQQEPQLLMSLWTLYSSASQCPSHKCPLAIVYVRVGLSGLPCTGG